MDYLINIVSKNLSGGNPLTYFFVLIAGIITGFTPCVYPVIPIIVGYIGALHVQSRLYAFFISLVYVAGMAVTFTILGVIASFSGMLFGTIQSNPWSYVFVGNVILIMALWFMGVINIPLPAFNSPKIKSKGLLPVFVLGLVSGIVTAPCTAAILGIILAYVATKQNLLFGATLLFTYAIGLGTLIIVAGTFTGIINAIFKSEILSQKIKKIFGIFLFLLSQYFFIQAGKLF
ncbi:MAG: cytochrome c biogenesis protein CcdA [Elusimicrobiota bacterium]